MNPSQRKPMDDEAIKTAIEAGHSGRSDPPGRGILNGDTQTFLSHNRFRACYCVSCRAVRASFQTED